ncbi:MAG TPA: biopolymer transporter ExbD [Candidatus Angelobacter sp.]|jgi:biopolymer transport protein ExbD/biopolymer transport protein TolR
MATAARQEQAKINSAINVTPMVDVMLVLLIIFMVITPMLHRDPRIEMARTGNPIDMTDANKADALIVAVMHDGRLYLGDELVTAESLGQRVKERLDNRSNKTVFLRADARARYQLVVNAVDEVRSAGADQLGLLTEQRKRLTVR